MFVCTTQTSTEKSTATHVDISKHCFRQSDSGDAGYNSRLSDATPSCFVHVSQPVNSKHTHVKLCLCHVSSQRSVHGGIMFLFCLSVCLSVHPETLLTSWKVYDKIHQTYTNDLLWDKNESFTFWISKGQRSMSRWSNVCHKQHSTGYSIGVTFGGTALTFWSVGVPYPHFSGAWQKNNNDCPST